MSVTRRKIMGISGVYGIVLVVGCEEILDYNATEGAGPEEVRAGNDRWEEFELEEAGARPIIHNDLRATARVRNTGSDEGRVAVVARAEFPRESDRAVEQSETVRIGGGETDHVDIGLPLSGQPREYAVVTVGLQPP